MTEYANVWVLHKIIYSQSSTYMGLNCAGPHTCGFFSNNNNTIPSAVDWISGCRTVDIECQLKSYIRIFNCQKSVLLTPLLFKDQLYCLLLNKVNLTNGTDVTKPVNLKGNQLWISIGRTDAEVPILWPPDAKSRLIGKDSDAGKDRGQEEKGMTEDEMVGWHHRLNGHEFEQTPGAGDGQGGLACCSLWSQRVGHDWATELNWKTLLLYFPTASPSLFCLLTLVSHCSFLSDL